MEIKIIAYIVIGILVLIALWNFVAPKTDADSLAFNIFGTIFEKTPNTQCYSECSMEILNTGESLESCLANKEDCN
ncbi:MAG: hypothetical protein KAT91_02000 [Candidatus Aenigmarchaeota archaeon]|nr:hypothetical protein [Candidatus Aenigmarchaeota archaeon]